MSNRNESQIRSVRAAEYFHLQGQFRYDTLGGDDESNTHLLHICRWFITLRKQKVLQKWNTARSGDMNLTEERWT